MNRIGAVGWVGLTLYVIGWDAFASETLSTAFDRGLQHPSKRPVVIVTWCLVTAHLFGRFLPTRVRRADPITAVARWVRRSAVA